MTTEEKERLGIVETEVKNLSIQISELKGDIKELWTKIDSLCDDIKKRLPLWATFAIAGMSSLIVGLIVGSVKR